MGRAKTLDYLQGAEVIGGSLDDASEIQAKLFGGEAPADIVISCIASRSGAPGDSWKVDHQANVNLLDAAMKGSKPAQHFVMLSAYCVRKPELVFQHAKLKFENYLRGKQEEITVRGWVGGLGEMWLLVYIAFSSSLYTHAA